MRKILVLLIVAMLAVIGGQTAIAFDNQSGDASGEDTNPSAGDSTSPSYYEAEGEAEITITTPADGAIYERDEVIIADYECTGADGSVLPPERCKGPVPDGEPIDMYPGDYIPFRVEAADDYGSPLTSTHYYEVVEDAADTTGSGEDKDVEPVDSGAEPGESGTETGGGDTTNNVFDSVGDTTNNIVHRMGDTTNYVVYRMDDTTTYVVHRTGYARTYVVDRTRYVGAICGGSMVDAVGGIRQGRLPETGGGWIALLLSGTTLVGGGLFLVRRFSR